MPRQRQCIPLRGLPSSTAKAAHLLVAHLDPADVLWVSNVPHPKKAFRWADARRVHRFLGQSFDAVILDLHGAFDPNVLGQVHGFVWGGGALILRCPPTGELPSEGQAQLAVHPYTIGDVGHRMRQRLEASLTHLTAESATRLAPVRAEKGTNEQASVVERLNGLWHSQAQVCAVLQADRGRGKSSALGLAISDVPISLSVCVTAPSVESIVEILKFASRPRDKRGRSLFVSAEDLAFGNESADIIIIDEAAQLPVPLLMAMVNRHPESHFTFSTTIRGYEGTGRGFTLRFIPWLGNQGHTVHQLSLEEPIRWAEGCPLERLVVDALLLNAEPAQVDEKISLSNVQHVVIEQDKLARDEPLLRQFFGLLVHAHYRTTPNDLRRILDAPNVRLHCLRVGNKVVAATWIALEGKLSAELCHDVAWGRSRLKGHALAETLISHSSRPDAGLLNIVRSVRIAVHPKLRRKKLATRLVGAIHDTYAPDLFGTLFGATSELLAFRRGVGYELVRVGASRGTRTGEPAAVMIKPVTKKAKDLVGDLRETLTRDLDLQLELMQGHGELHLAHGLISALRHDLASPVPQELDACLRDVATFAFGPRTLEAAASALIKYYDLRMNALSHLTTEERALIDARIGDRVPWTVTMARAKMPSIPATMRALRRAVRQWVRVADPDLERRCQESNDG